MGIAWLIGGFLLGALLMRWLDNDIIRHNQDCTSAALDKADEMHKEAQAWKESAMRHMLALNECRDEQKLHATELKNIRRKGKRSGAITGASA